MSETQNLLQRVDAAKAQLDSLRPLDREREDRVMQKFRLWWTYHSNAIEGNTLTQGETEMFLMEGLTAKGKPLKDHLDLRGHSNAINYLLGFIHDQEVLTEAAIRKLHEILLVEPYQVQAITPDGLPTMKTVALGQYKTQPNHVRTPTGETHYYASPEETPAKMDDLMTWYRDEIAKGAMHCVEMAARFHHQFTAIHPFDDGNGRMSRLLMNLMLMQAGYPPTVIRLSERDQYLAVLRRADRDEHDDFLNFIAEHVVSSLELFIRAAMGEEIHEPTDLEKEIALLKIKLQHIEEPEHLCVDVQQELFRNSIDPLFTETMCRAKSLSELFSECVVKIEEEIGNQSYSTRIEDKSMSLDSFLEQPLSSLLIAARDDWHLEPEIWIEDIVIQRLCVVLEFRGFKKARFDTFNLLASIDITFEPLKYHLLFPDVTQPPLIDFFNYSNGEPGKFIEHLYQEPLTKDEITEVAQKLTRFFVEEIKKKTNGHS